MPPLYSGVYIYFICSQISEKSKLTSVLSVLTLVQYELTLIQYELTLVQY